MSMKTADAIAAACVLFVIGSIVYVWMSVLMEAHHNQSSHHSLIKEVTKDGFIIYELPY